MKKILMIIGIIALLSLAGCGSTKAGKATGATATTAAGVVNAVGDVVEGDAAVAVTAPSSPVSCQPGGKWHIQGTGTDLLIIQREDAGTYAGYCHAVYTVSSEGFSSTIHYFLKEDGSGFQMFELNGQKYQLPLK